ncbi:MAG: hypothetical protein D6715_00525 [Calditrichaeota bacterium]|nr:MAG: hypothetical protein D6715_00525 [Calditrichota bacterium]
MRKSRLLFYYLPPVLWAAVIFVASSLSNIQVLEVGFSFEDKVKHGLVYAILGALIARALAHQEKFALNRRLLWGMSLLLGVLYGISDEFHQRFVPGRSPEVADALADALGVWLGTWLYLAGARCQNFFLRLKLKMLARKGANFRP